MALVDQKFYNTDKYRSVVGSMSATGDLDIDGSTNQLSSTLPRGSWLIDTPTSGEREYLSMQQDSIEDYPYLSITTEDGEGITSEGEEDVVIEAASSSTSPIYNDINYGHTYILPYYTKVKRIIIRSDSASTLTNIGVHTNDGETSGRAKSYFNETPAANVSQALVSDVGTVYTFDPEVTASAGSTLGVSISSTDKLKSVFATIVLEYNTAI